MTGRNLVIDALIHAAQERYTVEEEAGGIRISNGRVSLTVKTRGLPECSTEKEAAMIADRIMEQINDAMALKESFEVYVPDRLIIRLFPEEKKSTECLYRTLGRGIVANVCISAPGGAYARVTDSLLNIWNRTAEEVWKAAEDNMLRSGIRFQPIQNALAELGGMQGEKDDHTSMFVLANKNALYGAAVIALPGVLEKVAEKLDDSFYAIPSSVHEWIILPKKTNEDFAGEIRDLIHTVNTSCVEEEDFLSDDLFYYNRKTKTFGAV